MRFLTIVIFSILIVTGCTNNRETLNKPMTGEKPPNVELQIGNNTYETTLGTYCWNGAGKSTCVDTAGPVELLEGKEPIKVKPGESISFAMDYEPKPNKVHVAQIRDNKESAVAVEDNRITVPVEKGVYYYSYGVWWMDEKEVNVSHGDAFYAFALEVY